MADQGRLLLSAGTLQELLAIAVPKSRKKRTKPYFLTIQFDASRKMLGIDESRYALSGSEAKAKGRWPGKVQVDGRQLQVFCATFPPEQIIELTTSDQELCVVSGRAKLRLQRQDPRGTEGIKLKPVPKRRGHTGPVEVPPDPVGKRVALHDTWLFSARVPMPQHRDPKDRKK